MAVNLEKFIREVPDFPKQGIGFKDITTLLKDAEGFKLAVDQLSEQLKDVKIDAIAVVESRGFPFGSALAYKLGTGLLLVRKPGKLPAKTIRQEYELEYGTDALEIHQDAIKPGQNVLIVDDLLATGGTAMAVAQLVEKLQGKVAAIAFVVELDFLKGREKLAGHKVVSLVHYQSE
ncbi:MAG: adenine phosphoribosyltransferase [Candidatus Edwardsbacteria bacterium RIFOXYD12_FULL_50_11]|uniref:Adenine phosphoribosyltransferase n=1 Tax=Candidatus Edwardsbacteria bacterium GWF2_54_11 TaxID=1817851 RepID=A0A1F5RGS1_9BACT|nr:MAG: adenine phosphoribosyltransferase [Candidatus Edwardsbacteria bacterium RifOxyC12_full_54_24]OGF08518.1 MAG: adenine phosphoribosyltransferase [Candidatus Edwardsbacteria bacterium RifOxyA12_full_54_48]OGF11418.1 MAG: adenine phosphoribosyltransferase [Candidatus Edwardsbacteria bacterium GWE2_54_12]OGF13353.1 MAG: adenine phosphoribosyltransferase [Candidatus Edwardsbacteria bacterium GWF2_54_11]OGF16394.1 MAG: adenine phosphoribosyltransferase [Candidatus Edwardsbacteria bacterium RIF